MKRNTPSLTVAKLVIILIVIINLLERIELGTNYFSYSMVLINFIGLITFSLTFKICSWLKLDVIFSALILIGILTYLMSTIIIFIYTVLPIRTEYIDIGMLALIAIIDYKALYNETDEEEEEWYS